MMKVLVIGGGGREHSFAWKVAQSSRVTKVFIAPGNGGTAMEAKSENVPIAATDIDALTAFAREEEIELTIVGPEAPLVAGIADTFDRFGLRCFGPTRGAARLEGSKAFAKDFLTRHNIPTASYKTFSEVEPAMSYAGKRRGPIVIKADGLAAGKGVVIAQSRSEAFAAIQSMLSGDSFGDAGRRVVIEEFLRGEEASFIVMVDGRHILPLATSQDHKARDNADTGPNTGGMGAYSPAPVITPEISERIMREIIEPTVGGLADEGHPYTGFLYAGLMISADGTPRVLEFNCRSGDPETQPILFRLKSDLVELCLAALEQRLDQIRGEWDDRTSLGVVMAAGGYPFAYRKGDVISGLPGREHEGIKVFHAGTTMQDNRVMTAGGRVLCATALGTSVTKARDRAYELVKQIGWEGVHYRTDIGYRAIAREQT